MTHMHRTVAAAAVFILAPLAAVAQSAPVPSSTPAGPIAIDSCSDIKLNNGYGMGNVTVFGGHANHFFKIAFTNNATVPADQVTFQIDFDKSRITIGDDGKYVPGQTVTHTLRDHGNTVVASVRPDGVSGPTACAVVYAHFTDGTTYGTPIPTATGKP